MLIVAELFKGTRASLPPTILKTPMPLAKWAHVLDGAVKIAEFSSESHDSATVYVYKSPGAGRLSERRKEHTQGPVLCMRP